uniref:PME2ST n=1 Tax=Apple proliferation phytoplasma TaxID=37692 RepID=A0A5J6EFI7_APPPP|nr:PME2ST [Candidatus Phytoplasma mali]
MFQFKKNLFFLKISLLTFLGFFLILNINIMATKNDPTKSKIDMKNKSLSIEDKGKKIIQNSNLRNNRKLPVLIDFFSTNDELPKNKSLSIEDKGKKIIQNSNLRNNSQLPVLNNFFSTNDELPKNKSLSIEDKGKKIIQNKEQPLTNADILKILIDNENTTPEDIEKLTYHFKKNPKLRNDKAMQRVINYCFVMDKLPLKDFDLACFKPQQ